MTARKGNIYTGFISSALSVGNYFYRERFKWPLKAILKEMILDSYWHCAIDSITNSPKVVFNCWVYSKILKF